MYALCLPWPFSASIVKSWVTNAPCNERFRLRTKLGDNNEVFTLATIQKCITLVVNKEIILKLEHSARVCKQANTLSYMRLSGLIALMSLLGLRALASLK